MRLTPSRSIVGRLITPTVCVVAFAACGISFECSVANADDLVDFNRDVRPILSKHCLACHGRDEARRAKKLRLDVRESALNELADGVVAIVPGSPDDSELIERVASTDESLRMPPRKAGGRLAAEQIEILRKWIAQGANYDEHWAFVKPKRRPIPKVVNESWPINRIDYYILANIERAGLKPSNEADRYLLIRRASLDLRGLPPSPAEIDSFVNDTSPNAYEKMIDRFLADPAYGERWARVWLDLARYADSAGYGSDPLRTIWRYRDWVIDAFNKNVPYDRFTIAQIAGDLLPNATIDDRIATAFHRNTMTNTEGGTDDEEFRVAAVKDRVDVTAQVWMGLTAGCAKCHDHKYDPITQKEYYQLFAFFNQTEDADRPDESPTIRVETDEQKREIERIDARIAELKKKFDAASVELALGQAKWEEKLAGSRDLKKKNRAGIPDRIGAILDKPEASRSAAEEDELARYYRTNVAEEFKSVREEIAKLEKSKPEIATVPVMVELPANKKRETHVLIKGNFLTPGEKVEAEVPKAFHRFPAGAPVNRLGLAYWLVDRENPLTARVAVNRYWARFFGSGIVETEEDFGTQGDPPVSLDLLDDLALEYQEHGWDTKAIMKMIVMSATYRQSSVAFSEQIERDPRNRLLSRAPRFRLDAETVRDQALALGGILSRKMFGPSVFPPQPDGLWQAAFNGQRTWATSAGEDRHRRGIYTFWRRTVPYPSMAVFDAPSREVCISRRFHTNTPLQALVTLNDPVYFEAAQGLARRIVCEGGSSTEDRARYALKTCLCRPATDARVNEIVKLYRRELERFARSPDDALAVATVPIGAAPSGMNVAELAAWTVVSNALLNLDAVLMRG
jgi:hypothetical protein